MHDPDLHDVQKRGQPKPIAVIIVVLLAIVCFVVLATQVPDQKEPEKEQETQHTVLFV